MTGARKSPIQTKINNFEAVALQQPLFCFIAKLMSLAYICIEARFVCDAKPHEAFVL